MTLLPVVQEALAPPGSNSERIDVLDVLRGFALFGIFLMNIEFFNRPVATADLGMAVGPEGVDWLAGWFVNYFVQGKFWTIFALLFGMGFALMLRRAEQTGEDFLKPYLRRILALSVFGAAHYLLLWEGDILLTYASGAVVLLLWRHARPDALFNAVAVLVVLALLPELDSLAIVALGVALAGFLGLFLRDDHYVTIGHWQLPRFAFTLCVLALATTISAALLWLLPDIALSIQIGMAIAAIFLFILAGLAWVFHEPAALRELRLGIAIYTATCLALAAFGAVEYFSPATATIERQERATALSAHQPDAETETRVMSKGRFLEVVAHHAKTLPLRLLSDVFSGIFTASVFLIGVWLVRAGIMENTAAHLTLFRKLAWFAWPAGVGLGLLGSLVAVSHTVGDNQDGFMMASGLHMLGNLPACLGYMGMVVLMLHSTTVQRHIRVLAAPGRMALTNYLAQSLICALTFYGYGLGLWGMPRAQQLMFVMAVFTLQVIASHWWLSTFRVGPIEWFWRAFTYRQLPAMRL